MPVVKNNLRAFSSQFARSGDAIFIADGLSTTPPGTNDGLLTIADQVKTDFEKFKKEAGDGFKPSDYELTIFTTNHGNASGIPGSTDLYYTISGAPRIEVDPVTGKRRYVLSGSGPKTLKDFAARLPVGIRIKTVFGQCFGSNTSDYLWEALAEKGQGDCACGISQAGWNMPGRTFTGEITVRDAQGNITKQNDGTLGFEGLIASSAGKNNITVERALWERLGNETTIGRKKATFPNGGPTVTTDNGPMTSSDLMISQFFRKRFTSSNAENWDFLERRAERILVWAQKNPARAIAEVPEAKGLLESAHQAKVAYLQSLPQPQPQPRRVPRVRTNRLELPASVDEETEFLPFTRENVLKRRELTREVQHLKRQCQLQTAAVRFGSLFRLDREKERVRACEAARTKAEELGKFSFPPDLNLLRASIRRSVPRKSIPNVDGQAAAISDQDAIFVQSQQGRRLLRRSQLEMAFLLTAPTNLVNRYVAFKRCEREPLGHGRASISDLPSTAHPTSGTSGSHSGSRR